MDGYEFQGAMSPFYSHSHDYEMSWNMNQDYGGMEQQIPFSSFANSSHEYFHEGSSQAFISQPQWCSFCGGNHFVENCYILNPTNHVPQQPTQGFCANMSQATYQGSTSPNPQPLWCILCGGPHEAENCFVLDPNYQYQGQTLEPPYQEFQQECQPLDPTFEMNSTKANTLMNLVSQLNELQVELDHRMAKWEDFTIQEPFQDSFSNGEVLEELLLPNEGHEVDGNEKEDEDLREEDEEIVDECIEMETLSGEKECVELKWNGDDEQLEDSPIEDVFKKGEIEETCGTNKECSSLDDILLDENFRTIWEPGGIDIVESVGPHLPIFISNDSHFLLVHEDDPRLSLLVEQESVEKGGREKNQVYLLDDIIGKEPLLALLVEENEGIILDFGECDALHVDMKGLSLREFIDGHHLKSYLEDKIDGTKGIFILMSFDG